MKTAVIYWSGTVNTEVMVQSAADGAVLVHGEGLIVNEVPDDELERCRELGKALAE